MTMVSTSIVFLCCFLASVLAVPVEKYTDKYDNLDIQEIIGNKKLLKGYTNCLLERGPCTPEGKELKANIGDALETGCTKCTKAQHDKVIALMDHVILHEHDTWKELTDKYDPEGVWRKKYEDEAKQRGISLNP